MESLNSSATEQDNEQFEKLKEKIALTPSQLIELTYSEQKFTTKITQLNDSAIQLIQEERYQDAAVYLDEAQKVLEYSAGCGRTIERSLIITILNNQSCLLQKINEFQQSSNYLQAIIHNIGESLDSITPPQFSPALLKTENSEFVQLSTFFQRKSSLALYQLRFCALSSHLKNNDTALKSAQKALKIFKQLAKQQSDYEKWSRIEDRQIDHQSLSGLKENQQSVFRKIFTDISLIKEVAPFSEEYQASLQSKALSTIKRYEEKVENQKISQQIQDQFENYSIGNLMQNSALPIYDKDSHSIEFMKKQFSLVGKLYRILHLSMAFFTMATQLRLLAASKYQVDDNAKKLSQEFRTSKLYHLVSIILITEYFPCKCIFFDHVIFSFKNHYQISLVQIASTHEKPINKQFSILEVDSLVNSQNNVKTEEASNDTVEICKSRTNQDSQCKQLLCFSNERSEQNFKKKLNQDFNNKKSREELKHSKRSKSKSLKNKIKHVETSRKTVIQKFQAENVYNIYYEKSKNNGKVKERKLIKSKRQNTTDKKNTSKKHFNEKTNLLKSRSKSKKQIEGIKFNKQKSKNNESRKIKSDFNINQEYGVKTIHKENKIKRNSNSKPEGIKFNKLISPTNKVAKLKSPINIKNALSQTKRSSKDKFSNF